jgi:hypothetical protein
MIPMGQGYKGKSWRAWGWDFHRNPRATFCEAVEREPNDSGS